MKRAALLAFMLAGCAMGPNYHLPAPSTGAVQPFASARSDFAAAEAPPERWWQLYNDATLDALVDEALLANKDLAVAEANLRGAQAVYDAVRGGRLPSTDITASASYGRSQLADALASSAGRTAGENWTDSTGFAVSYQVDLFGRIRRGIEAARGDTAAVEAARDAVRVTVAAQTAAAYAEICTLGQSVDVATRSLDIAREVARTTQRRQAVGIDTAFDVTRAQALVAQTAAAIPPIEGQRRGAMFMLAVLLGRTPADLPAAARVCRTPLMLRSPLPVGDGAALLRRRPDLRQAERSLAASTARVGVAIASLYPNITLGGSIGLSARSFGDFDQPNALSFGLGPLIAWSVPNQAVGRAQVRQARAGADAALSQFDSTVLRAVSETEQVLTTYAAELDRNHLLGEVRARSGEAVRLATIQRREGALPYLDLLTAQQTMIAADGALAASDRALAADQVAVFKALGGGWQIVSQ